MIEYRWGHQPATVRLVSLSLSISLSLSLYIYIYIYTYRYMYVFIKHIYIYIYIYITHIQPRHAIQISFFLVSVNIFACPVSLLFSFTFLITTNKTYFPSLLTREKIPKIKHISTPLTIISDPKFRFL